MDMQEEQSTSAQDASLAPAENASSPLPREASSRELVMVKKEREEIPGTSTALATADVSHGYEEGPDAEGANETMDVAAEEETSATSDAGNANARQPAPYLIEPSPIERRIREHTSYNQGNWTSEELKALYEGITVYGTTDDALDVIQKNFCMTRTYDEVIWKVNELREINREHRVDRMRAEGDHWLETGYQHIRASPQHIVPPEINNWEAGIQRVNRQLRSHNDNAVRTAIENALMTTVTDAESPSVYKVTDYRKGRGYGKEQTVSWQRLGSFFAGVVRHVRPLPALNALECAIALRIVDDVEDEVSRALTDEDKAIIRGWLTNIQMRHLSDFLPDVPYEVDTAAQILVDPLRTRLWNIPEQGCSLLTEPPDVEVQVD